MSFLDRWAKYQPIALSMHVSETLEVLQYYMTFLSVEYVIAGDHHKL